MRPGSRRPSVAHRTRPATDTFKDESAIAAAVGGGSHSTQTVAFKDEAAIAAAIGGSHSTYTVSLNDPAALAATIRGMALNYQLDALNRQSETHTQFVARMNQTTAQLA